MALRDSTLSFLPGCQEMTIDFVLISNLRGQLRLSHRTGAYRERNQRQILENDAVRKCLARGIIKDKSSFVGCDDGKLVYRRYGRLIVVVGISDQENELAALEFIHLFMETLDKYFEKVTEMHILFHLDKVNLILQEMIVGGNVVETSVKRILAPMYMFDKLRTK